jgi:RNA polymerase sigma-70 factor (ECF subfamily)
VTREQELHAMGLMRLAQSGDQYAYATLLVLLTGLTRNYARGRVGSAPWVDDVVQETLLAVHGARQTYDSTRPFGPWFYAIASSRLVDALRREKRVMQREISSDVLPEVASDRERSEDAVDVEAVHAAVASLPPKQRAVIEELKFKDQSVREVAGRMRMTESAVKVTAHRGYRALRRLLGVHGRED